MSVRSIFFPSDGHGRVVVLFAAAASLAYAGAVLAGVELLGPPQQNDPAEVSTYATGGRGSSGGFGYFGGK